MNNLLVYYKSRISKIKIGGWMLRWHLFIFKAY